MHLFSFNKYMAYRTLMFITCSCESSFTKSNTCFLGIKKKLSQWQIRGKLIKYIPGNGLILTVSKDINNIWSITESLNTCKQPLSSVYGNSHVKSKYKNSWKRKTPHLTFLTRWWIYRCSSYYCLYFVLCLKYLFL